MLYKHNTPSPVTVPCAQCSAPVIVKVDSYGILYADHQCPVLIAEAMKKRAVR